MRTKPLLLPLIAAALTLAGCSGGSTGTESKVDTGQLQERLTAAKKTLDSAETITISLATKKLPSGVTGLLSAKGKGNHTPAFDGKVTVITGGSSLQADVIALGGKVYARTSFAPAFLTIKPEALKAPDPASLFDAKTGITQILAKTGKLTGGKKSRDGDAVLTTISGMLPGSVVRDIIPSAPADDTFSVTYRLSDDDILRDATLTGPFYGGDDVSYKVKLATSDTPVTIKAP